MYSPEQCSRRFDFLRLHRWAWSNKLISTPFELRGDREARYIHKLLQLLIGAHLKRLRIAHKISVDPDSGFLCIEFHHSMQLLKQMVTFKSLPGQLQWHNDNSSTRRLIVPTRRGTLWCASEQYKAFEQFLRCETSESSNRRAS